MVTRNQHLNQRMNWFDRQFVRAQDFADESDYHVDRRRRHLRTLHTPGVAEGMLVRGLPGDSSVTVDPGTAIDDLGHDIVLLTASSAIPLPSVTTAELYVSYAEAATDQSQDPGITGYTRITETPSFSFRETAPGSAPVPADGVLLATVAISSGQLGAQPDNTVRTGAGAALGDIAAFSVTLKRVGQPSAAWPRLTASGPNQVSVAGDLRLSGQGGTVGALTVPGSVTLGTGVQLTGTGTNQLTLAGDLNVTGRADVAGVLNTRGPLTLGGGMQFGTDAPITAISRDRALSGASDSALPSEAAVKAYADSIKVYAQKSLGIQTGMEPFDNLNPGSYTRSCNFSAPFAAVPQIFVTAVLVDVQPVRYNVSYASTTTTGFTLQATTMDNSYLYHLYVAWLAFGPLA